MTSKRHSWARAWHAKLWDSRDTSSNHHADNSSVCLLCLSPSWLMFCCVLLLSYSFSSVSSSLLKRYTNGDLRAPQVPCFVYNDWTERQVKWSCTLPFSLFKLTFFFFSFLHIYFTLLCFYFPFSVQTMVVTAHYSANLFFFLFFYIAFPGQWEVSVLWENSWRFISNELVIVSHRLCTFLPFCWGRRAQTAGFIYTSFHKNKDRQDETMRTGITSEIAVFSSPSRLVPKITSLPRQFNIFVNKAVFVILIWCKQTDLDVVKRFQIKLVISRNRAVTWSLELG